MIDGIRQRLGLGRFVACFPAVMMVVTGVNFTVVIMRIRRGKMQVRAARVVFALNHTATRM